MGKVGTKMRVTRGMISQRLELQALYTAAPIAHVASGDFTQYWSRMRAKFRKSPGVLEPQLALL